jgi:predicted RNA binding protein YcfA (HicA-like mRNA interferase family)
MKVTEILKMLSDHGWYVARTHDSHPSVQAPDAIGVGDSRWEARDDLAPETLNSIVKQARLKN